MIKKTLAIFAIIACVLGTSIVFATDTKEAIESMPSTQSTLESMFGNNKKDTTEENETNSETKTKTENNKETKQESDTNKSATSKIVDMKKREKKTMEDYKEAYGSDTYGLTAYILGRIQIYSIPFCFLGIAISAIYQYVLGARKLDTRDKGFAIMISIITVFVIAQVLPLIFAVVVKGWRG